MVYDRHRTYIRLKKADKEDDLDPQLEALRIVINNSFNDVAVQLSAPILRERYFGSRSSCSSAFFSVAV